MASPQYCQSKNVRSKASNHQMLFKQPVSSPKNVQFQQIYEMIKKESEKATKTCFSKASLKPQDILNENGKKGQIQNRNNGLFNTAGKKPLSRQRDKQIEAEMQKKRLRALSSKKFDCITKKTSSRRSKNFTKNLLEYVKLNECGSSNSKKSTDNSNSSQIQKMKNQNEKIYEYIKAEEKRIKLIEKQINEEKKKHESEKQLYNLNIQKLKKKVCNEDEMDLKEINQIRESFLSEGEQSQDYDRFSIDSK